MNWAACVLEACSSHSADLVVDVPCSAHTRVKFQNFPRSLEHLRASPFTVPIRVLLLSPAPDCRERSLGNHVQECS